MKIEAAVDKMMYGTIKVDIPDEQLRDISKREERAIVWNAVQAAIRNGTPVEWDNITGSVAYHGDYRTIGEEKWKEYRKMSSGSWMATAANVEELSIAVSLALAANTSIKPK